MRIEASIKAQQYSFTVVYICSVFNRANAGRVVHVDAVNNGDDNMNESLLL